MPHGARRLHATRSSASASSSSCRRTRRATSTTPSPSAPASALASPRPCARRRSATPSTTRRRSTSSRHSPTSATAKATCRRPSAPPARTSASRSGQASPRSSRSRSSRRSAASFAPPSHRPMVLVNRHRLWQLAVDGLLVAGAWYVAFWLVIGSNVRPRRPAPYPRLMEWSLPWVVVIPLAVFILSGFYNRWWRYVSTRDMWGAARGVTLACILSDLVVYFAHHERGFPLPRSVAVLDWLLLLAAVT